MEVAPESPPLLLAGGNKSLARAPQVARQAHSMDRRPRLPCQVIEHTLVVMR